MKTQRVLTSILLGSAVFAWSAFVRSVSVTAQQPASPPAKVDHPEMPAGPGKEITLRVCSNCHSITNVTAQRKDADGWTATITKMVGYGAVGSEDDFGAVLEYLTKNYGPTAAPKASNHFKIQINKEAAPQLADHLNPAPTQAGPSSNIASQTAISNPSTN